eukprot:13182232-Alexandrium_andersonii.AAC.1
MDWHRLRATGPSLPLLSAGSTRLRRLLRTRPRRGLRETARALPAHPWPRPPGGAPRRSLRRR